MAPAEQDPVSAECGHAFCRGCIGEYTASAVGAAKCPSCSEPLTINFSATTTVRLPLTRRTSAIRTLRAMVNPSPALRTCRGMSTLIEDAASSFVGYWVLSCAF